MCFTQLLVKTPESIYCSEVNIDNNWELVNTKVILKPTYNYEGSDLPLKPSNFGSGIGNELRDPLYFC